MRRFSNRIFCLLILAVLGMAGAAWSDEGVTVSASPVVIQMGAQYDGVNLKVSGTIPDGCDAIVRLVGAPESLHLREKGKIFALLWMNVGSLEFENVPKVYLVATSKSFETLGAAGESYRVNGLKKSIKLSSTPASTELDPVQELLRLKMHDKLYAESATPVQMSVTGSARSFSTNLAVPSALKPGQYTVEVIALRDGEVAGTASAPVQAALTGFPEWLSHMAFDNGLMYGILSTIIAILSGLAIGMIFQSKGAH